MVHVYVDHPNSIFSPLHSNRVGGIKACVLLQVTVEYQDNKGALEPLRVHTVVLSVQHVPEISLKDIRHHLMEKVVKVVIPAKYLDERTIYHLLPSGKFLLGGPQVIKMQPVK